MYTRLFVRTCLSKFLDLMLFVACSHMRSKYSYQQDCLLGKIMRRVKSTQPQAYNKDVLVLSQYLISQRPRPSDEEKPSIHDGGKTQIDWFANMAECYMTM